MLQPYAGILADAAVPQKLAFLAFAGAVIAAMTITLGQLRRSPARARPSALLAELRLACPIVGLLCAALNALHMMQTTLSLPFAPTAKMLAPGLLEMAALVAAGALAGLIAVVLSWVLEAHAGRQALKP